MTTIRISWVGALAAVMLSGCVTTAYYSDAEPAVESVAEAPGGTVSVSVFDDQLSPYGEWMVVPRFGRVWRPSLAVVGPGFTPYQTGGHWVYTELGWSWVSDFDWGWATFHYGRWMADPAYGWLWVPGTVWGPAWVDWRYGGGYVGWTPMAPAGVTVVYGGYRPAWMFVETRYLVYGDVYRYRLAPEHYHQAFAVTQVQRQAVSYHGARWYAGPPPGHVASAVGRPIQPVRVAAPPPGRVQAVQVPRSNFATVPGGRAGGEPGTPRFAGPPPGTTAPANRGPGRGYSTVPPSGTMSSRPPAERSGMEAPPSFHGRAPAGGPRSGSMAPPMSRPSSGGYGGGGHAGGSSRSAPRRPAPH